MADTEPPEEAHNLSKWQGRLRYAVWFAVAAIVLVIGATIQHFFFEDATPWNPLGPYPTQTVKNAQRFVDPDGVLLIEGVKCVAAHEPVTIEGHSQYQSQLPPGTLIPNGNGTAIRYPAGARHWDGKGPRPKYVVPDSVPEPDADGCSTFHYENVLPEQVKERAAQVCAQTGLPSLWTLTGAETPVRKSGQGVVRAWASQPFRISCTDGGG